ncbi:SapC family protein [Paremcibacter congregatus]|uniref:Multidrug transporter n=1 Tax=Paremcibacter congregatus TaxID=2043170 RepID=A0A2G4YTN9_9PROT|nr:SapC family protein [Paremcibacter congregatus]PHZ84826.1 multidrug transporter [Paremcibacter congregatus]QDE26201.1 SapC family protein [Paremcibacter congregatus]
MPSNFVPLNPVDHGLLKIRARKDFRLMKDAHVIPLGVHEFFQASAEYPVVFVKNSENGQFIPVAMMGLKPGENLFVGPEGWEGLYIPMAIRNHPFHLMRNPQDEEKVMVAIDEKSTTLSLDEGARLFKDDGSRSDILEERMQDLRNHFESSQLTESFTALVTGLDLLAQRNLTVEVSGETIDLEGIYFIDEVKLNAVPDDQFLDLRQHGFLPLLYAQMVSVHQIRCLASLQAQRK